MAASVPHMNKSLARFKKPFPSGVSHRDHEVLYNHAWELARNSFIH